MPRPPPTLSQPATVGTCVPGYPRRSLDLNPKPSYVGLLCMVSCFTAVAPFLPSDPLLCLFIFLRLRRGNKLIFSLCHINNPHSISWSQNVWGFPTSRWASRQSVLQWIAGPPSPVRFWYSLPVDSIWSHRLRAPNPRLSPTSDIRCKNLWNFWATSYKLELPQPPPLLGFD